MPSESNPALRRLTEWKSGVDDPVGRFEPAQGQRVRPLEHGRSEGPDRDQDHRPEEDELRLERQADPAPLGPDVADDREAEAAEHDQGADRDEDRRRVGEVGEAAQLAEEIEAAVVERRDRVEDAPPGGRRRVLTVQEEGRSQHQRPGGLADDREHRDAPDEVA